MCTDVSVGLSRLKRVHFVARLHAVASLAHLRWEGSWHPCAHGLSTWLVHSHKRSQRLPEPLAQAQPILSGPINILHPGNRGMSRSDVAVSL